MLLLQSDLCFIKRNMETETLRMHTNTHEEVAIRKLRRDIEENKPAETLPLNFSPLEL